MLVKRTSLLPPKRTEYALEESIEIEESIDKMARRFLYSHLDFDFLCSSSQNLACKSSNGSEVVVLHVLDIRKDREEYSKFYMVFKTKNRDIIKIWITDIIYEDLKRHDISYNSVFLRLLSLKLSNTSGRPYFNFSVVIDPL